MSWRKKYIIFDCCNLTVSFWSSYLSLLWSCLIIMLSVSVLWACVCLHSARLQRYWSCCSLFVIHDDIARETVGTSQSSRCSFKAWTWYSSHVVNLRPKRSCKWRQIVHVSLGYDTVVPLLIFVDGVSCWLLTLNFLCRSYFEIIISHFTLVEMWLIYTQSVTNYWSCWSVLSVNQCSGNSGKKSLFYGHRQP